MNLDAPITDTDRINWLKKQAVEVRHPRYDFVTFSTNPESKEPLDLVSEIDGGIIADRIDAMTPEEVTDYLVSQGFDREKLKRDAEEFRVKIGKMMEERGLK